MSDAMESDYKDFACVTFLTPDGRHVQLGPGHMIGRSVAAALRINEPGVSEAHALVSLRGSAFKLIALRGRFKVGTDVRTSVDLVPGLEIAVAHGVCVSVVDVVLPESVLGLMGDGLARQILPPVASLVVEPTAIHAQFLEGADALMWWDGEHFYLRRPGSADRELAPGFAFDIGARRFTCVRVPISSEVFAATQEEIAYTSPLTVCIRTDSVRLTRGRATAVLTGLAAEIIAELAKAKPPIRWVDVSERLWPAEDDRISLRQKWDRALARLRQRLRASGIHEDFVQSMGDGRVELMLAPADKVEDERF